MLTSSACTSLQTTRAAFSALGSGLGGGGGAGKNHYQYQGEKQQEMDPKVTHLTESAVPTWNTTGSRACCSVGSKVWKHRSPLLVMKSTVPRRSLTTVKTTERMGPGAPVAEWKHKKRNHVNSLLFFGRRFRRCTRCQHRAGQISSDCTITHIRQYSSP